MSDRPSPPPPDEKRHASIVLRGLIDDAADMEHFTFGWLTGKMPANSLGIIGLFLSLLSLLPVIDIPARLLILFILGQVILGNENPVLPRRFLAKQFSARYLVRLDRYAIPALRYCEKVVRPRWINFLRRARRGTALIVFLLTILSLILPIPLSNVPPAIASALIALAYLENDGLLLLVALLSSLTMLASVVAILLWAPHMLGMSR